MTSTNRKTADIVILGAGVMGASIAFHLAKRKAGRIVVLEKDNIGQGNSGRSSALVRMHYSFPPEVQLAVKSLEVFNHWKELVDETGDFHRTGFLRIVPNGDLDVLRANVAMQKKLGVNVELVDQAQLQEIEPEWHFDDVTTAAYEPDSGYGDGSCVANDFMAAARDMGVEYRRKTPATGLLVTDGKVRCVQLANEKIEAGAVIAAIGPWSKSLFQNVGVDLPIENEFHEVVVLRNPPDMKGGGCACIDSITTTYFRSDASDKTLVGDFLAQAGTSVKGAYDVLVSMGVITSFVPYLYLFATMFKLQREPAGADVISVPGGTVVAKLVACLGFTTTVVTIALSLLPPPDEPNKVLAVGKIVVLSGVLLGVGAVFYYLKQRQNIRVDAL